MGTIDAAQEYQEQYQADHGNQEEQEGLEIYVTTVDFNTVTTNVAISRVTRTPAVRFFLKLKALARVDSRGSASVLAQWEEVTMILIMVKKKSFVLLERW